MTTQLLLGTDSLIDLTKKNAPYIYQKWVTNQINKLNRKLNELRNDYRHATGDSKKEIENKGKSVKETLNKLEKELF